MLQNSGYTTDGLGMDRTLVREPLFTPIQVGNRGNQLLSHRSIIHIFCHVSDIVFTYRGTIDPIRVSLLFNNFKAFHCFGL